MDSKDNYNEDNLNFHYDREERLKEKNKFKQKKENKTKSWLFILLKIGALIIVINIIVYLSFSGENSKSFSVITKEMVFKDEVLVEVNLKSKIEEEQKLLVFIEKEDFITPSQNENLLPKEEKILYFSLPYKGDNSYILVIEEEINRYSWEKSF